MPADVRMVQVTKLQVQEAMLTGESLPVSKNRTPVDVNAALGDRKCMGYSATLVMSGQVGRGYTDEAEGGRVGVAALNNARAPPGPTLLQPGHRQSYRSRPTVLQLSALLASSCALFRRFCLTQTPPPLCLPPCVSPLPPSKHDASLSTHDWTARLMIIVVVFNVVVVVCVTMSLSGGARAQGLGVVVLTGDDAEIGKISRMVGTVESVKTNLMVQLEIFGRWISIVVIVIAFIAFCLAKWYVG